jgi:hypothetical protein
MKKPWIVDPLEGIREAVLDAASLNADPGTIIALLLKISGEIALTTSVMGREDYDSLADSLWRASEGEMLLRIAASKTPASS